jgi:hypothetical protein
MAEIMTYLVFLMYRSEQQFYNKQIDSTVFLFVYFFWMNCYMFRPCRVIINHFMNMLLDTGLFTDMGPDQ